MRMNIKRRDFLRNSANSALGVGLLMATIPTIAAAEVKHPSSKAVKDAIIGGKSVSKDSSKIKFTAPEIAENGKVVPIKVELPGIHASKVKSLHIITEKNVNPKTADVFFTKHNEEVYFQTRFKMGKTQDVTALVVMQDGSVLEKTTNIKITIGGCG